MSYRWAHIDVYVPRWAHTCVLTVINVCVGYSLAEASQLGLGGAGWHQCGSNPSVWVPDGLTAFMLFLDQLTAMYIVSYWVHYVGWFPDGHTSMYCP